MPSLASLEKLLTAEPNDPFLLYGIAQEHAKLGNYQQAVVFFDRCLKSDPSYCYAYYHKALALESSGDKSGAMQVIESGLIAAARHGDAHCAAELRTLRNSME